MIASRQIEIPFYRSIGRQRGGGFGELGQLFGRTQFRFCGYMLSQLQKLWELTC